MARRCDAVIQEAMKSKEWSRVGPLFGIPFSVKDNIDMKGFRSTVGCAHMVFDVRPKDAYVVKALK